MATFFWTLGRTLQVIALIQVGAALFLGMQSNDATLELKLLSFGALEFLVGLFLIRQTGKAPS